MPQLALQPPQNRFQNRARIPQDVVIPEPQHDKPLRFQPCRSIRVVIDSFCVLPAIGFDHQLVLETDEIHDVTSDRCLPPEFVVHQSSGAEVPPQAGFRFGGSATHLFGEGQQ